MTERPLRNRVGPWGDLHSVEDRGLFTGNRGCLVDGDGRITRHHNGSLWIVCETTFRGWNHPLNAPRTWTPLFFLDDAAALAAGHRPCGLCRRESYLSFRSAVSIGSGSNTPILANEINTRLARERYRPGRGMDRAADRIVWRSPLRSLPPGTVVLVDGTAHLVTPHHLQRFTFGGWGPPVSKEAIVTVEVLTPPTSVAALEYGFVPVLHATAET
ncbi:MAG: hypothetical protein ACR2N7_10965 [Acidimicrobiia bacterium]